MFRIENKSKIIANISGPKFFTKIEIINNSNKRLPALKNDEKNKFLNIVLSLLALNNCRIIILNLSKLNYFHLHQKL